jgi:hypothetical protein
VADLSAGELAAYAREHVVYEVSMFARAVGAALGTSREVWPENIQVEELALHLRNLLDFFYPPSGRWRGDVVASDFFAAPGSWSPAPKSTLLVASTFAPIGRSRI